MTDQGADGELQLALVGTGAIANRHATAIAATPGITIAGVLDREESRAQAFAERYRVPRVYGSWSELLGDRTTTCLAITAPPDVHADLAVEAFASGRDVVCEKPIGRTTAECDRILEAAAASGRLLLVGHNRVFEPAVERMAEIVRTGGLGRVFLAQSNGLEPPELLDRVPWLRTELSLGGVFLNQAVHAAYLVRWLLGEVDAVLGARTRENTIEMTREDTAVVTLELRSGALAVLTATFAVAHGPLDHEIVLFGTGGWLRATRRPDGRAHLWGVVPALFDDEAEHDIAVPAENAFERMWVDYVGALRGEHRPRQTGHDGRAAVAVVEAAYRSMREGGRVTLLHE
ncbi:MAG: Gfo/Idh/MocA family oxidoreductase [Candidatus Dormibacteraeota bacterium]|nr:Gfo/Idh/MocA family oxidoreductase [Candidatus Dormibacteraeota bacterium]